jgi:hypothetical protein
MNRHLFLLILTFTVISCINNNTKKEQILADVKPNVEIKFTNLSNEEIKKLKVIIVNKEFHFESLKKGETTKPLKLEEAYEYCFAEIITTKDTLIEKPMTCGNEKKYKTGELEFQIFIEEHSKFDKHKREVLLHAVVH